MSHRKKTPQRTTPRKTLSPARSKQARSGRSDDTTQRLQDLVEQIDIMVPEMTARIAALEHLLLEKDLCTREELIRSREFVRMLEG